MIATQSFAHLFIHTQFYNVASAACYCKSQICWNLSFILFSMLMRRPLLQWIRRTRTDGECIPIPISAVSNHTRVIFLFCHVEFVFRSKKNGRCESLVDFIKFNSGAQSILNILFDDSFASHLHRTEWRPAEGANMWNVSVIFGRWCDCRNSMRASQIKQPEKQKSRADWQIVVLLGSPSITRNNETSIGWAFAFSFVHMWPSAELAKRWKWNFDFCVKHQQAT